MKRRGERGAVHVYLPEGGKTYYIRYSVGGVQKKESTGHTDEGLANVFAANVARMIGLQNGSLDEKMRLVEIAKNLIRDCDELEGAASGLSKCIPTSRQWFARQMEETKNRGDDRCMKEGSRRRLQRIDDLWLAHLSGLADQPLSRVTSDDVRAFLVSWKEAGFSGKTRRHALNRIRAVMGRAVDAGLVPHNVASARKLGRMKFSDKSIRLPFNQRQLSAILEATKAADQRMYLASLVLLLTGQRAGDCCAMEWKHVRNLDGSLPTIVIVQQKTGTTLVIPLAEVLRKELQKVPPAKRTGHLLGEMAEYYVQGQRRRWIKAWRKLLNSLDLPSLSDLPVAGYVERAGKAGRGRYNYSAHSFRHTLATLLSGISSHYMLGHRSEEERGLGTTAIYRNAVDLYRIKAELDAIQLSRPDNVIQLAARA
ncbi:MAG: tyrosine-type recombinase/integrase [Verrucomicrobiia bacterium]|jgi:integrase